MTKGADVLEGSIECIRCLQITSADEGSIHLLLKKHLTITLSDLKSNAVMSMYTEKIMIGLNLFCLRV